MSLIANLFKKSSTDKLVVFITAEFNIIPKNLALYKQAFTHKSVSKNNNERLEFLGDSILSGIITTHLYDKYPQKTEGELSKLTAKLVNRQHLNKLGEDLKLIQFIQVIKQPEGNKNILGNTLEAIIGAIYLDYNFDTAQKAVLTILKNHVSVNEIDSVNEDYKSQLLIWSQKNKKKIDFITKKHFKSDVFEVTIKIDHKKIISAKATSKKRAENEVAKKVMEMFPTITAK